MAGAGAALALKAKLNLPPLPGVPDALESRVCGAMALSPFSEFAFDP